MIFFFVGDPWSNPEELTELLGVEPKYLRHLGDTISEKVKRESPYTIWLYASPYIVDNDLNKLTESLLNKFENKAEVIREYLSQHTSVEVKLWFVVKATQDDFPGLYLNPKLISFLGRVHACIDFDIYIDEVYRITSDDEDI